MITAKEANNLEAYYQRINIEAHLKNIECSIHSQAVYAKENEKFKVPGLLAGSTSPSVIVNITFSPRPNNDNIVENDLVLFTNVKKNLEELGFKVEQVYRNELTEGELVHCRTEGLLMRIAW